MKLFMTILMTVRGYTLKFYATFANRSINSIGPR